MKSRISPALFSLSVGLSIGVLLGTAGCQTSSKKVEKGAAVTAPAAQPTGTMEERLRAGIDRRIALGTSFGIAAAFREGAKNGVAGKSVVIVAGKKSIEPVVALKETDVLEIGEVSEVFVGILIHLAAIEGRLKLDSRIDELLPVWAGKPEGAATVVATNDFALLGLVLEKVYHRPYRELFRERLARPLKIKLNAKAIRGFDPAGIERAPQEYAGERGAAVAVRVTAREMRTFVAALVDAADPRANAKNSLHRAISAAMTSGLGWDSKPGEIVLRKRARTAGFASALFVDRAKPAALLIVAPMSIEVENLGAFALGIDAKDQTVARIEAGPVVADSDLNRLKGRYVLADSRETSPREFEVSERAGRLVLRFGASSENERESALLYPVIPEDEDEKEWGLLGSPENEKRGVLRLIGEKEIRIRFGETEYRKLEEKPESYPAYEKD